MSESPAETPTPETSEFAWRVTKRPDSKTADIELGEMYADFDGPALTALLHTVGRGMIQVGTMALESCATDDDEDWDE